MRLASQPGSHVKRTSRPQCPNLYNSHCSATPQALFERKRVVIIAARCTHNHLHGQTSFPPSLTAAEQAPWHVFGAHTIATDRLRYGGRHGGERGGLGALIGTPPAEGWRSLPIQGKSKSISRMPCSHIPSPAPEQGPWFDSCSSAKSRIPPQGLLPPP